MVSEASGGNPPTLCRGTPIDLSSRATLSLPRGKTLSTSPPPNFPRPFLGLPHRLRYLHPNPPSLFSSLSSSLSLLLLQSVPSSVYVSRSLEQPLLVCRFFSSPSPPFPDPRRSLLSAVALARWYSTDPAASFPLSSPTFVPRTRTPLQKNSSPVWAQRGVSPFVSFYPLPIIPPLPLS